MEKIYGSPVRQDGLYKTGRNRWVLIYGFGKDNPEDEYGWNWREHFDHRPTAEEVKETITATINAETDRKILTGFTWQGKPVWLSAENQMNFQTQYTIAKRFKEVNMPLRLKLGETAEGEPVYHTFEDIESLGDFVREAFDHIYTCIAQGWAEKDAVDYEAINRGDE